jgi:hypothetical protein
VGQYRLAFYFKWQLGLNLEIEADLDRFNFSIPFITVFISWSKFAKGVRFFKD